MILKFTFYNYVVATIVIALHKKFKISSTIFIVSKCYHVHCSLVLALYYIMFSMTYRLRLNEMHLVRWEIFRYFSVNTLFSLTSVGVVMAVENNMKTPKSFGGKFGVLNGSISVIVVMYIFIGFCGFLKYGPDCDGSITLNLPQDDML